MRTPDRSLARPTVVVIDDDPDNRMLLEVVLDEVADVVCFDGPDDALARIDETAPHLILLDMSMPGMNGVELLRHLRERANGETVPIVMHTANPDYSRPRTMEGWGFDGALAKPILSPGEARGQVLALARQGRVVTAVAVA